MIQDVNIVIPAKEIENESFIEQLLTRELNVHISQITAFKILKKSLDARNKYLKYNLRVRVGILEEIPKKEYSIKVKDVSNSAMVHIIGAGPAGYFAALECIEQGFKPIVFERGKDVRERRRDLKAIHQEHSVNPESNYCFGEGGAGTYSDGKLYTRSKKRGNTLKVLEWLVGFGADENILIETHPHIGTNKLPKIIANIRAYIIKCGGEVHFNHKLTEVFYSGSKLDKIELNGERVEEVENVILATGHSARDIFELLYKNNIKIVCKGFALGVRIEHPQEVIDKIQYHGEIQCSYLPPASYSLVTQAIDRGVYSFCMCPGGIIAPCATDVQEVVTNGWSPSKRNNPYANSGIVVEINPEDIPGDSPMKLLDFQKKVEFDCWVAGGKTQKVPAQRLLDFLEGKVSKDLPKTSYQPGVVAVDLNKVLPPFIVENLKKGFISFGDKMKGYLTNEAVIHAPESRTSSPIRIPRDEVKLCHPEFINLYPCGEGAGFAGGIASAAIDGMRCVQAIKNTKN